MCNLTLLLWACCQQVHQHLAHFSLPPLTLLFFNSGPICYLAKTFGIFQCHVEIYQRISFHRNPWHARANLHSLWRGSPQSRGIVSRYNPFWHFKSNEHFDGSLLHHSFQFPLCFKTTLFSRCFLITITPVQLVVYSSAFEHCFYGKGAILNAIHYYYYGTYPMLTFGVAVRAKIIAGLWTKIQRNQILFWISGPDIQEQLSQLFQSRVPGFD